MVAIKERYVINRELGPIKPRPIHYNHFLKKEIEASRIYHLWYPRPKPQDDVTGTPQLAKRIEALLNYGYSFDEMKEWFRLGSFNARASTNTVKANAVWEDIKAVYGQRCAYCGKKSRRLTKDHVVPISKGGSDNMDNIVPACFSCNCKKKAKNLLDWSQFRKLQLRMLGFN